TATAFSARRRASASPRCQPARTTARRSSPRPTRPSTGQSARARTGSCAASRWWPRADRPVARVDLTFAAMGVLDDAIREHLELKRRRGASPGEIARAEAEALGPPRHSTVFDDDAERPLAAEPARRFDDEAEHHAVATRVIEPMEDVAPP